MSKASETEQQQKHLSGQRKKKTKNEREADCSIEKTQKERRVAVAHENKSGSYRRSWENASTLLKNINNKKTSVMEKK
jgi:hypothetical protein